MFEQAEIQKYNPESDLKDCPADKLELRDQVHNYALAAVFLYGVITLSDFIALFEKYKQIKLERSELYDLLLPLVYENEQYFFYAEWLVNADCQEDLGEIYNYHTIHQRIPRYLPDTGEEFIDSAKDALSAPLEFLVGLLASQLSVKYSHLLEELEMLDYTDDIDQALAAAIDLSTLSVEDQEQLRNYLSYYQQLEYELRYPEYNGYRRLEVEYVLDHLSIAAKAKFIYDQDQALEDASEDYHVKVGRNEPCPCQSGKKFKKCCGRQMDSPTSKLSPAEAEEFSALWEDMVNYFGQKGRVREWLAAQDFDSDNEENIYQASVSYRREHPQSTFDYVIECELDPEEKMDLLAWSTQFFGSNFVVLRYEADGALLGAVGRKQLEVFKVHGVKAPLGQLIKQPPPYLMNTTLIPYGDKIVTDEVFNPSVAQFKPSFYPQLYQDLKQVEEKQAVVTDLREWYRKLRAEEAKDLRDHLQSHPIYKN